MGEGDWRELRREVDGHRVNTGQQYAEVRFVPNWIGHSKNSPEYRIAIREPLRNPPLPGLASQLNLRFPSWRRRREPGSLWSGDQPGIDPEELV